MRTTWTILTILFLCTGLMARVEPGMGQVWHKSPDNPLLTMAGNPGTWNTGNHGYTYYGMDIIWDGSEWKLYITGQNEDGDLSAGLFTAEDPFGEWTEYEGNPVLAGDGTGFDARHVYPGAVMLDGDTYKMWYAAAGPDDPCQTGYATSTDGINWTRMDEPVLTVLPDNPYQDDALYMFDVLKREDGSYLGYFIANGNAWQVCVATSEDGITWDRSLGEPILDPEFLNGYSGAPHVFKTTDQYVMWFYSDYKTCVAISEDGLDWRIDKLYLTTLPPGPAGSWDESLFLARVIPYEDHFGAFIFGIDGDNVPHLGWAEFDPTVIPTGNVSGTWTKAGSPYLVEGEITIPDGETLTIEAGTTVEFLGHYPLNVQGRILAEGSEEEPIRFWVDDTLGFYNDAGSSGVWGSIRIHDVPASNDSSIFRHCDFQFSKRFCTGFTGGGAISIHNVDQIRIEKSLFNNNRCIRATPGHYALGGAIGMLGSSPEILTCVFENNYSDHLLENYESNAGAIWVYDHSHPKIRGNRFKYNWTTDTGGAIGIWEYSDPLLENNMIVKNRAVSHDQLLGYGGGISIGWDSHPILINNTIADNEAGWGGGGLYFNDGNATIINTIVANNEWLNAGELEYGHQMAALGNSQVVNTMHFNHSLLESGVDQIMWGAENTGSHAPVQFISSLSDDPHLLSNNRLGSVSPCIGAGAESVEIGGAWYFAPTCDCGGDPRPQPVDSNPDMGAFEHARAFPVAIEEHELPTSFTLYPVFPNPFNPTTTIRYSLPEMGELRLVIYDVLGHEVAVLHDGPQETGSHTIRWHARDVQGRDLPAGVYLARLEAGSYSQTIKMLYLR